MKKFGIELNGFVDNKLTDLEYFRWHAWWPQAGPVAMIDNFVMDIKNYSASVSGSTSPALIIMFGVS